MGLKKNIMKRMFFYLFSAVCVGGCFWLYAIKIAYQTHQERQPYLERFQLHTISLFVDFLYTEAGLGTKQQDMKYEIDVDDAAVAIKIGLDAQLTEKEKELEELEEKTKYLQMEYRLQTLLEDKSNELKDENPNIVYEKYLQIKQGELARICGIEDMSEYGSVGNINSHFSSPIISIDNNLYVQYSNLPGVYEYALPGNILVTGSNVDLGFMNARAGMNFQEIWENAYEKEIQEGFMYTEDIKIYFVEFEDGLYDYIYYSYYPDGKDTWLIICKK